MHKRSIFFVMMAVIALFTADSLAQTPPSNSPIYIAGALAGEEAQFKALLDESYSTIRSPLFQSNMNSLAGKYPTIALRATGTKVSNGIVIYGTVTDILNATEARQNNRYVRAAASLVGGDQYRFGLGGIIGDNVNASLTLGRASLTRWLSPDLVRKSCAVNTAAHEISHTISSSPTVFRSDTAPFQDGLIASRTGQNAVASYLVGAVAQCTWLQQKNYSPRVDLQACVEVFGHRGWNQNRCIEFDQIPEIKVRTGANRLSDAQTIID